ncbi:c-type cytochrome domain-containing protein [Planctomyces sp. SH-PL62]|uniref:c-type cytochrome domain-containing protein n=1 Tax=Planctomyces sp. SH-PL62 TaxID=1636152 RepID=UPI00078CB468|nr:c-type cytochrome domain-containing protein [Planctomyces sp. SH-PL62]AMV38273.1 WD domain, G-beta repeat [Planctomyces sp. SH-PL62]
MPPPILAILLAAATAALADEATAPDYQERVAPILKKYCAGCHNDDDLEGEFSVDGYASIQRGTEHGPAFLPGDPRGSLMLRLMTGAARPAMPPKDEPKPTAEEIATIEAWIASGARGPDGAEPSRLALIVPEIPSRGAVRPIVAMDASRDGRWTAVARDTAVTLYEGVGESAIGGERPGRAIGEYPGKVTAVHFTPDGKRLVTASGVAGTGGVAAIWNVADGALIRSFEGHRDLLYDAELSPDGTRLATCGYDKVVEIRDAAAGTLLRTLEGHTGAVYDVAFSPDGRFLVSASADDTCKVWRVEDGLRMDTLPQPLKAESCCLFSPDGRSIVAAGADSNIRVWRFVSREKPEINPMVLARFAHEGAIVRLGFSPDGSTLVSLAEDRTIKAWRAGDYTEIQAWGDQPDVATALAFSADGSTFTVGRMDGSTATYALPASRSDVAVAAAPRPRPEAVAPQEAAPVFEAAEREPDDHPDRASPIQLPARVTGVITAAEGAGVDADLYRFPARAGEEWVFEVDAARSGSKLDSFLEVLDGQGRRVPRVVLQAVRDSYFTFRGKNGTEIADFRVFNWEEMAIDDYLYANGEVVKLWLFPRGPDSGFFVYPGRGDRWGFFDTTPLAHALNEPCYVVEPHPPGTKLLQNGLPVFTLHFENDDDARRELGKDSRLNFTAPADGEYLLKIRDVRGLQGPEFRYTLTARPRRPDFTVALEGANPTVSPGIGREFKVSAHRLDDFEGPIRVDFEGVPPGFQIASPLVIEAGQLDAFGVVFAEPGAAQPTEEASKGIKVTATARIGDREIVHEVGSLGAIKLGPAPKLKVAIVPDEAAAKPAADSPDAPAEFVVEAGRTIALKVVVERADFPGQVPFGNEGAGRNLPFGTFVDDLGLNGLLVLEGRADRTFFVTAHRGTPEQVRPFHLTTAAAGGVSSRPVRLRVVRPAAETVADAKARTRRTGEASETPSGPRDADRSKPD